MKCSGKKVSIVLGIRMNDRKGLGRFILNIGEKIVAVLFSVILLYLFLLSIFTTCFMVYTDEHVYYLKDFPLLMGGGLCVLCLLLALLKKRADKRQTGKMEAIQVKKDAEIKKLQIAAITMTAILGTGMIWFILHMNLPPIYDQGSIYGAAGRLLAGDYSGWKHGEYFSMLPYQNGMVLMMCPFVTVFGERAALAIQICNVPALFAAYLGLAKTAGKIFDRKCGYYTYLGLLLVIPMWTQVTFVYGVIYEICLAIWAVYLSFIFEREEKWRYIVGSGICIMFAILWKSNAEIFMLAIIIMLLMQAIRKKSLRMIGGIGIILICGLTAVKGAPFIVHIITGEDTTSGIPMMAWLAMGLQESSIAPGWYNEFPMNLYRHVSSDPKVIQGEVWKSFQDSFRLFSEQKEYAVRFFARKLASMWADPAFQFFTTVNTRNLRGDFSYVMKDFFYNGGIMNTVMYLFLDIIQSIYYFGVVLYLLIGRKKLKLENGHLIVVFLGGFLFHFIGEAKSHYVVPYYLMLMPYAVQGYRGMAAKLSKIDLRDKEERKKLYQKRSIKKGIILAVVIIAVSAIQIPVLTNTLKLGGEERDYIWYCTNETQWKEADYKKI